ncbi:nucleoside triphosphate pyrophosphohydrolase [Sphingomonas daechungensis]|uniref:nucleoside triphosphate pyrophosphohydrolase n=1 Tax=Sphingomonas daechungensis TaxID=1176646 RepID=UPI0037834810
MRSQHDGGALLSLERLVSIMKRLRDPVSGCEWDSVQTFATIAPYTIEEAYEVADAIAREDMDALADELGDLQLQVVFHSRMAEEAGKFTLDDVLNRICDKMERRHPHIFGNAKDGGHHLWEIIKAEERAANPDKSALAGVALALPALERAAKLQRRAARTGFDWPDASGARAKVYEELDELERETEHQPMFEEMGDLLFAVVNLARKLNIEPEAALRAANYKFERRFREIERAPGFSDMSLDEMEDLWTKAKKSQAASIA